MAPLLILHAPARADEPIVLRMAAIAPEGTGWARELKATARELETATHGAVHMKWYLGGIAGDETAALERIRRGQLDGAAGALFCGSLSPTLTVMRVAGLVQSRDEASHLLNHLRPLVEADFKAHGMVLLVVGNFGNDIIFMRRRVDLFSELQKTPMWIWSADSLLLKQMELMGMHAVPSTIEDLSPLYDHGQIDGMFVLPTAALAYQWATRAHYFIDLRSSAMAGCLTISQKAYDSLSFEQQRALQTTSGRFGIRFEELGRREDALLMGSTFEKQGVKRLEASAALREAFLVAAASARERLDPALLPRDLLRRAMAILSDYRALHAVH